jgi:PTH1 family peptidyl-tRNA hydrolase
VVGLGNPGDQFEGTRHNVGAAVVQLLADRAGAKLKRTRARALTAGLLMSGKRVVIAFPLTYMNNSGESVRLLVKAYGIQEAHHIIIVHDELDLEPGQLRLKAGGGTAGNNGLKSVTQQLGTTEYIRLRIGIGKPPHTQSGSDWVLRRPGKADRQVLDDAIERAADAVEQLMVDGVAATMAEVNRRHPPG